MGGNPDEDYGIERESVMHGDYAEEVADPLAKILKTAGVPAGKREAPVYNHSTMEEEETDEEKKSGSSVLPAVAAGVAGAGLGYMAGKAASGSSTKAPTSSSSSTTGSDQYGSWGAPGAPTATGKGLGIDPPAAGSALDTAMSGMLENELNEFTGPAAEIGQLAGVPGAAIGTAIDTITGANKEKTEEGELGTAVGAGLGGAVGGIGGAALGGLAGHYLTKDKEVKKESDDLDRMSSLAGIKKKVADESLLAPLVGAVGGAALGGELASGIGSKFGSEVGGSIGQAAGQEQAGKLGALVGGMKGSSAGAVAGGEAAKKFGQVAGGIAGLAGGAAIDQAKKSNDDEETNEGSNKKSGSSVLPVVAAGAAGAGLGYMASKMGKPPTTPPSPAEIASGTNPMGDIAGSIFEKDNEETDEGWKGQLAGGLVGTIGGGMAGAALGGPIGAMIGSAAGGGAGGLLGDKLGGPEETDEGVRGALAGGAVGGYATRSIKGAVAGAKLGSAIQDRFAKKDDTSPLAGQYGHSGKMKEVSKDTSFLDRLKELSGLKR
jgi:hypothetical protein